jgi:threonine dehydrogenase-like Zn-dependent dehydrogenase
VNLIPIADPIPDEVAVFVEPLAAAYEIFEQIKIPRNHRVLVLGDGRLGALVAMTMKVEGYDVVIGGHHPERGTRLGFEVEPERDLRARFDVVIDCTGASSGFARALELVRPRGTIILKSTAAASADLNLAPVVINEITVLGSRCGTFRPAIDALASGKLDPRPLISATLPLDDGLRALDEAAKPANFKILLKVS